MRIVRKFGWWLFPTHGESVFEGRDYYIDFLHSYAITSHNIANGSHYACKDE